jgi:hypothetical protein
MTQKIQTMIQMSLIIHIRIQVKKKIYKNKKVNQKKINQKKKTRNQMKKQKMNM